MSLIPRILSTIETNIVKTPEGVFIAAGANQFRTLWTRDFCYSVPGLLRMGYHQLVEAQLKKIFELRREDGLLPRGMDCIPPQWRVVRNIILQGRMRKGDYRQKLKPEYLGEHKTPAFDSNLLFLNAYMDLLETSFCSPWLSHTDVHSLLSMYASALKEDLIFQPAFSDWQDSAQRQGPVLLTHLLYLHVQRRAEKILNLKLKPLISEEKIFERFKASSSELFREFPGRELWALDSQLLFLESEFIGKNLNKPAYYQALKNHPLWSQGPVPGIPLYPKYSAGEIAWTVKAVGLRHYHDGYYWGWLIAWSYKVARLMGDGKEAERILNVYQKADHEAGLAEIYRFQGEGLIKFKGWLYTSEGPFTWTAARWAETQVPGR